MSKNSAERRRQVAIEMRARREREARRRKILKIVGIAAAVVLVLGGGGFLGYMEYQRRDLTGVREYEVTSREHVTEDVDYAHSPPVGGDHNEAWQNCGVYDAPLREVHAVHSLEHGAVWITYDPELPGDQVEQLESLYRTGSYLLVSPYEGEMDAPIVASVWGKQLAVDSPDDQRLSNFIRAYEKGPQTPEPGAACSGAVDFTAAEITELLANQEEVAPDVDHGDAVEE